MIDFERFGISFAFAHLSYTRQSEQAPYPCSTERSIIHPFGKNGYNQPKITTEYETRKEKERLVPADGDSGTAQGTAHRGRRVVGGECRMYACALLGCV